MYNEKNVNKRCVLTMIEYKKHQLSRLVSVQEIVSADFIRGIQYPSWYHDHQDAWEMCTCLEGEVSVIRDNSRVRLLAGQTLFVKPGTKHGILVEKADSDVFVVSFTCTNDESLLPLQSSVLPVAETHVLLLENMKTELDLAYERRMQKLHLLQFVPAEDPPLGAEQAICCYLELSILHYLRNATMDQGQIVRSSQFKDSMHAYLVGRVTQYIDEHLQERLTVEEIAAQFHYSRVRLSTIYKSVTGFGISEIITQKRIHAAKVLLLEQKKTVAQIAEELGFSSQAYFSRRFTNEVGCRPSKYAAIASSDKKGSE